MGCECQKPIKNPKQFEINPISKSKNNFNTTENNFNHQKEPVNLINEILITSIPTSTLQRNTFPQETFDYPTEPFCQYIYEHINKIRTVPVSFINDIKQGMNRITEVNEMRNGKEEKQLIYKSTIKVALNRGIPAFEDAITFLTQQKQLHPLQYKQSLCVPLPTDETDLKDREYIKAKVDEIRTTCKMKICSFWRDIINDAETSFLLMVVDDTVKKVFKRGDIFNEEYKYIGISAKMINKTFAAYFTFAK